MLFPSFLITSILPNGYNSSQLAGNGPQGINILF